MQVIRVAVCLLIKDGKVLLAQKNGGRGHGHWGGYGGKFELNESPKEACKRELWEESKLVVKRWNLKKCGVVKIRKAHKHKEFEVHIYTATKWSGIASGTKEMRYPNWFDKNRLPLRKMWPTDKIWIPWVLAGKKFRATFESGPVAKVTSYQDVVVFN